MRPTRSIVLATVLEAATVAFGAWLVLANVSSVGSQLGVGLVSGGIIAIAITAGETLRDARLTRDSARRTFVEALALSESLDGLDFSGKDMRQVSLIRRSLANCVLAKSNLESAVLTSADLSASDLQQARLRYADLREADLRWADLRAADLQGADLRGANLMGADFSGANLINVRLDAVSAWGANFEGAILDGAQLHRADFGPPSNAPVAAPADEMRGRRRPRVAPPPSTRILKATVFKKARGWRTAWSGANLSGCDLTDADFRYSTFSSRPLPTPTLLVDIQLSRKIGWTTHERIVDQSGVASFKDAVLTNAKFDAAVLAQLGLTIEQGRAPSTPN